jgi:hypothetical protein
VPSNPDTVPPTLEVGGLVVAVLEVAEEESEEPPLHPLKITRTKNIFPM